MKVSSYKLNKLLENNPPVTVGEPALKTGTWTASIAALLSVVAYIVPGISSNVLQVILIVAVFVLPIISAIVIRKQVWTVESVKAVIEEAVREVDEAVKNQPPNPVIKRLDN